MPKDFFKTLKNFKDKSNLKIAEISRRAKLSRPYVSNLINGGIQRVPSDDALYRLDAALGANGRISSFASSASTECIKVIYQDPSGREKLNALLDIIARDPAALERALATVVKRPPKRSLK